MPIGGPKRLRSNRKREKFFQEGQYLGARAPEALGAVHLSRAGARDSASDLAVVRLEGDLGPVEPRSSGYWLADEEGYLYEFGDAGASDRGEWAADLGAVDASGLERDEGLVSFIPTDMGLRPLAMTSTG